MDFQATLTLMVLKNLLTYDEAKALWDNLFGKIPPPTLYQCIAEFEKIIEGVNDKK